MISIMPKKIVELDNVSIGYDNSLVMKGLSFSILENQKCAIMGYSGCGKSTLFRALINRHYSTRYDTKNQIPWQTGKIEINPVTRIGYVPQEPSLASWLNVKGNIFFGANKKDKDKRCLEWYSEVLSILKLREYERYFPMQLSVGTAKRVALARALVIRPNCLFLDEPFTGFDFDIRESAINLLKSYFCKDVITTVMVTHDPYEAASVCSDAVVLQGRPAQQTFSIKIGLDIGQQAHFFNILRSQLIEKAEA